MKSILSFLLALVLAVSLAVVAAPATPVSAATINVPGNVPTILAAVQTANPGDTIVVSAGTYTENVPVTKPLNIQGAGMATTIVTADDINTPVFSVVSTASVNITGFTITGADNSSGIVVNNSNNTRVSGCNISDNYIGVRVVGSSGNTWIRLNDITGNTKGIVNAMPAGEGQWSNAVEANQNWWGHASGPGGPRLDPSGQWSTGLLPGQGDNVTYRVWCMPWLTRPYLTVANDAIAYFGISTYANQGWNIISTPIALDQNVTDNQSGQGHRAHKWGGLKWLGEIEEGDDYALKLYYTVQSGIKVYSPIYYWNSDNMSWAIASDDTAMNPIDGYYVRMKEADSIPLLWSPNLSAPSKYLYAGWNLVGYSYMPLGGPGKSGVSSSLDTALKTIELVSSAAGDVKGYAQLVSPPMNQYPFIYIPPARAGDNATWIAPNLQEGQKAEDECMMVVGRGYWLFMVNPGRLAGLTFTPFSFDVTRN